MTLKKGMHDAFPPRFREETPQSASAHGKEDAGSVQHHSKPSSLAQMTGKSSQSHGQGERIPKIISGFILKCLAAWGKDFPCHSFYIF